MPERENSTYTKSNLYFLIILAVVAFAVFANSISGEFVYDDNRQITQNPLIQNASLYGKAMTSDVWAFKGDGTIAGSNYYRPTFTAWLILNFQLFGLSSFGWHLTNILLHVGVCLLAFLLLRRWGLDEKIAFAISLIFAVHPVHTESVAWISGSPDLLLGLCLLASMWFAENISDRYAEPKAEVESKKSALGKYSDLIFALVFYAFALGSKEVAILCFPLFYLTFAKSSDKQTALKLTIPFLTVAVLYFALRWFALGALVLPTDEIITFGSMILTIPAMFVFYLKQMIFPLRVGANHSLRPVTEFSLLGFVLPLIISLAAIILFWLLAGKSFVQKIGFAIFILTLLPAMNASAFTFEQIVHDRYLYLPLLGFLMMIFPYFADLFERIFKEKAKFVLSIFVIILAVPLAFKTFIYNRVWTSELALWSHAVTIDEKSAFNWSQLGVVLSEQGKTEEAINAYNNSIDIRPTALALMGLARNFTVQKKYDEAVWNLKTVVEMPNEKVNAYTLFQAYESLAIALTAQNDYANAEKYLLDARKRLPIYFAALTEKISVILYQQNRKNEALKELEDVRNRAKTEFLPASKTVLLRLGMLYAEIGRKDDAKNVLQEYLKLTAPLQDKISLGDRKQALELLKSLN
jgi:protein O-mannosyl-transferase